MKNIVHFLVVFLFQSNIVYLFLFSISCEPVLNSPYEFGTSEFYRTQSFVCLVNPSSVCNTNPNKANDTLDFNAIPGRRLWLRAEGLPFANSVHQVSILQNGGTNVVLKFDGIQTLSVTPGSTGYTTGNFTFI